TPLAQQTMFDYDQQGRQTSVSYADGTSVSFGYNLLGQLTNRTDALGSRYFSYNVQGLLTNVSSAYGSLQSTVYDANDRPFLVTDENGVTILLILDGLGRLQNRSHLPSGGQETFAYSERGLISHTDQLGKVTRYTYDEALRRTS